MILLRTRGVDAKLIAFADQLEAWSRDKVCYLVDERNGPVRVPDHRDKLSLNEPACRALGLHCPADFAWRCGDYGLYIARNTFPDVRHFWMIESDVRILGRSPHEFFRFFAGREEDFLASYVERAPPDWPWFSSTDSADRPVYKCFFPVSRFSAAAIDALLKDRQRHSRQWARRRLWANDEAFVATALVGSGWPSGDFNHFGTTFYTPEDFSFERPRNGDLSCETDHAARLYHPVLFGEELHAKLLRLEARTASSSIFSRLDRRFGFPALAALINSRTPW